MAYVLEKLGSTRCALDASKNELFTQKKFADLIYESHAKGQDYILSRVFCKEKDSRTGNNIYYCYDAKQLCKHVFEMVITSEGRKIRVKNFKDPANFKEIAEINFFKLRHDSETPLKAEFIGNHISFLESNNFRSKVFSSEDPLDALSVNFQFKTLESLPYIKKKKYLDGFILAIMLVIIGVVAFLGLRISRAKQVQAKTDLRAEKKIFNLDHKDLNTSLKS